MSDIDVRRINLNLIPALSALLSERAVGAAARQVGVSQSAMSHSLAGLRALLGDPLLVRQGRSMTLTPRAQRLADTLPEALEHLRKTLSGPAQFEASTAKATFTIATVDYFELAILPSLLAVLAERAPGIRLRIRRLTQESAAALQRGHIDLILGGAGPSRAAGLCQCELYRDPFKVIARPGHPGVGRKLSLRAYLEYEHVLVQFEGEGEGAVDRALAQRGQRRRVGLWVPHFFSAPLSVASSDMLSTVASAVAYRAQVLFGLRLFEPPIALAPAPIRMWWPRAHDTDPAQRWMRGLIASGDAAPPHVRKLIRAQQRRTTG